MKPGRPWLLLLLVPALVVVSTTGKVRMGTGGIAPEGGRGLMLCVCVCVCVCVLRICL